MSNTAYWVAVGLGGAAGLAACAVARAYPGRVARTVGRAISLILLAAAVIYVVRPAIEGGFTAQSSLPFDLCDVALVIAAVACWWPSWQLGVELTYFWGMAGTLQAILTPDLSVRFPHLEFFDFVIGHVGIVVAALYLVVSLKRAPRPGSVPRIFAITIGYAAFAGLLDWITGGNYMYLAHVPSHSSLLSVLGPWPWYIGSAAGIALVLLFVLDAPFRIHTTPGRKGDTSTRTIGAESPAGPREVAPTETRIERHQLAP